jgi:hypothetical protein
MALKENKAIVPGTPAKKKDMIRELRSLSDEIDVISCMRRWSEITTIRSDHPSIAAQLFLVILRKSEYRWFLDVRSFSGDNINAPEEYLKAEKANVGRNVQVALLSVDSIDTLRTAYPNYHGDTSEFIKALEEVLHGRSDSPLFGYRGKMRR